MPKLTSPLLLCQCFASTEPAGKLSLRWFAVSVVRHLPIQARRANRPLGHLPKRPKSRSRVDPRVLAMGQTLLPKQETVNPPELLKEIFHACSKSVWLRCTGLPGIQLRCDPGCRGAVRLAAGLRPRDRNGRYRVDAARVSFRGRRQCALHRLRERLRRRRRRLAGSGPGNTIPGTPPPPATPPRPRGSTRMCSRAA